MLEDRIFRPELLSRVMDARDAAALIEDGMVVGMSGFTSSGEAMAVPLALAERAKSDPLRICLMTGASLGHDIDKTLAETHVLARRIPFQSDPTLRKAINSGEVMYIDQHLSETVEQLRSKQMPPIDIAVVEAVAIKADGGIVPSTSVGNSASYARMARKVIIELNLTQPTSLEGLHDIYIPQRRPSRQPIPILDANDRPGRTSIPIDPDKIVAIVVTEKEDSSAAISLPDDETSQISHHLNELLLEEVRLGRQSNQLHPLQAGVGSIANAVLHGFLDSPFDGLSMYSEVLQDSTFELFDAGKLNFASGSAVTLSNERHHIVTSGFKDYKDKLVLRPQEITNHPEVIRRLGLICINTALEFDIYGNVNSTHVCGTKMMNGIGGSGDFARNAYLSIFVTKSIAKGGAISSVVPMVSHVDHCEHDVDILVTEQGLADLRGLAPRERAVRIIENCAHPDYKDQLRDYFDRACAKGGHTPHLLQEALSWHHRLETTKTMKA